MYFNSKKNNTNIDNEFNEKNNVLSLFVNFFSKYKKIILISLVIIVLLVLMLIFFMNRKITNYLILSGDEIVTIYQGSDYIEPGYTAYNSKDEDLTSEVSIDSNLNNNVIGEYEIIYTLGEITKTRIINVIDKPQEYTFIHLTSVNNSVNIYLKKGEKYTEPGYQAFNTSGIDLTDKVKVTSEVDTSKKGTYKLTYTVVDSNNVTISVSRKVIVMDSDISLTLDTEKYTNKEVTINAFVVDEYFDYMILPDNTKVTTKTYSYKVSSNGTYTFKVYNKKGNTKESSIKVKNIDKTAPSGSCSGSYKDGVSTINVNASDNIGINRYVIDGKNYTSNKITINSELTSVNITIYDKAGNSKNISCNLEDKNEIDQTPGDTETGIFIGQAYDLTDKQLRGIAMLCQREQGTAIGAAAEASLMVNRFELYGSSYGEKADGLYKYIRNAGWWANAKKHMDNTTNLKTSVLEAVREVIVLGKRTLPPYIDEHDCIDCGVYGYDIIKLEIGEKTVSDKTGLKDRSNYIKDTTIIYNKYGAVYTFYNFPTETSDPFGYTAKAKNKYLSQTNE